MPRAYKGTSRYANSLASRRTAFKARTSAARGRVVGAARGYLRTGGYYRGASRSTGELKFVDSTLAGTLTATAGAILPTTGSLLLIPQDGTESGRVGRKVTLKSIAMRGTVVLPAATGATSTDDVVRIILVQDKQCNGAAMGVTDLLETATADSFNNLSNKSRFRVLFDKKVRVQAQGAVASGAAFTYAEQRVHWEKYIKLNMPIEYDNSATTGATATIRSNNITALVISTDGTALVAWTCRVRYTD